jgi:hypothetical protein
MIRLNSALATCTVWFDIVTIGHGVGITSQNKVTVNDVFVLDERWTFATLTYSLEML